MIDHGGLVKFVARCYGVLPVLVHGRRRTKMVAHARSMCMAIEREATDLTLPQLGRLWERDHTTILGAVRAVANRGGIPPEWLKAAEHYVVLVTETERVLRYG